MNHKSKVKLLSLSIAVLVVFVLLIIPSLNGNKKEAGVLDENKKSDGTESKTALNTENETGTLSKSDTSNKQGEIDNKSGKTDSKLGETDNKKTVISKETKENINALIKEYYGNTKKLDGEVLAETKDQKSKKAVESITEKREGIEKYNKIKTIIRAGLEEGTYLVFTTYNMKFFNIETEAPGMSVVYVVTDKNGTLAINQDTSDPKLQNYINELSQEEDIKSEIERVNTELASATKKDKTLKDFIDKLQKVSK